MTISVKNSLLIWEKLPKHACFFKNLFIALCCIVMRTGTGTWPYFVAIFFSMYVKFYALTLRPYHCALTTAPLPKVKIRACAFSPLTSHVSRLTSYVFPKGVGRGGTTTYHRWTNTAGRAFWPVVPVDRRESAYAASLTICSRLPPFRNRCKF